MPPDGRLDIEAIDYRDGAVFVGFKSPLTDKHEAVIVRLSHPLEVPRPATLERLEQLLLDFGVLAGAAAALGARTDARAPELRRRRVRTRSDPATARRVDRPFRKQGPDRRRELHGRPTPRVR